MFEHDALFYRSDDEFTEPMSAFVSEGLEAGESAVCVATERNNDLLARALGPAARQVLFIDAEKWYRRPATTIEGYHRVLNELTSKGAPMVRVIGEVRFGDRPADHHSWTRYESVLNKVFEDSPAWIVCLYNTDSLPDDVLTHASQTHSQLWENSSRGPSDRYLDPSILLKEIPEPYLRPKVRPMLEVPVTSHLGDLRAFIARAARRAGLSVGKCEDLMLAVNEMVTNVVRYADGQGRLTLWDTGPSLVCEVMDDGPGLSDPFAGYIPPQPDSVGGMGLWIARQLADRVAVAPDAKGTKVQLVFYR